MSTRVWSLCSLLLLGLMVLAGCTASPTTSATTKPTPTLSAVPISIVLTSPAFRNGQAIPPTYTCAGASIGATPSPPLAWSSVPQQTTTFLLTLGDVTWGVNNQWVLFNLPASTRSLPANIASGGQLASGARQGTNDQGTLGYDPPCIIGQASQPHDYRFTLYALDVTLNLAPGADINAVLAAASGHMLAQGQLNGTYNGSPVPTPRS